MVSAHSIVNEWWRNRMERKMEEHGTKKLGFYPLVKETY